MVQEIFIIGTGSHAEVIYSSIVEISHLTFVGFVDTRDIKEKKKLGYPIYTNLEKFSKQFPKASVIVGIGDNDLRVKISNKIKELKLSIISVIDQTANISSDVIIGNGVFIGRGAIINSQANIGDYSIINTGAIVEHHNNIGLGVHIGPGVKLGGKCVIGINSFVGIGSTVLQNRNIGHNSIIGAGAVVINDIPDNVVAVGIPAKEIKKTDNTMEISNIQAYQGEKDTSIQKTTEDE